MVYILAFSIIIYIIIFLSGIGLFYKTKEKNTSILPIFLYGIFVLQFLIHLYLTSIFVDEKMIFINKYKMIWFGQLFLMMGTFTTAYFLNTKFIKK